MPEPPGESSRNVRRWIEAARDGDERAFTHLVEAHMRAVHALAWRMLGDADDADDVAQETFVRAYQALDRYDPRYPFAVWLRTIATRLALNELAKRRRRRTDAGPVLEHAIRTRADGRAGPDGTLQAQETRAHVEAALDALPAELRSVLVLRVYEGMTYDAIARELEVPRGTVMSRLHRARHKLRQALAAGGVDVPQRRKP